MTQEEKQLLLIDLSARLPYGVNILVDLEREFDGGTYGVLCRIEPYVGEKYPELKGQFLLYQHGCLTPLVVEEVRPYLRPMSSMTDEEMKDLKKEHLKDEKLYAECLTNIANGDSSMRGKVIPHFATDWCNKNHFDYRGLIPMGLALEAPADMYKTDKTFDFTGETVE